MTFQQYVTKYVMLLFEIKCIVKRDFSEIQYEIIMSLCPCNDRFGSFLFAYMALTGFLMMILI